MNAQKLFGVQHYLAMHKSCLSAFITLYENKIIFTPKQKTIHEKQAMIQNPITR